MSSILREYCCTDVFAQSVHVEFNAVIKQPHDIKDCGKHIVFKRDFEYGLSIKAGIYPRNYHHSSGFQSNIRTISNMLGLMNRFYSDGGSNSQLAHMQYKWSKD